MNYYLTPWKKYVTFSGRASRAEYWTFTLVNYVALMALGVPAVTTDNNILLNVATLIGLAMLLPSIAVTVRRLHDTGRKGWWVLISLIPYVGAIVMLVFTLFDGQPGNNKYGPNPKGAAVAATAAPAQ